MKIDFSYNDLTSNELKRIINSLYGCENQKLIVKLKQVLANNLYWNWIEHNGEKLSRIEYNKIYPVQNNSTVKYIKKCDTGETATIYFLDKEKNIVAEGVFEG